MKMKKNVYIPVILSALMLTACGSPNSSAPSYTQNAAGASVNSFAADKSDSANEYASEVYEDDYNYETADVSESSASSASPDRANNKSTDVIKKEMLVYSCNMSVDVLDFSTAIDSFRSSLDTYGAFVETENYSDGGSNGHWYYADSEKWQKYSATVRVPSENYDAFCSAASQLGDLRSKNASVENMSREYYDLSATLDIYEAKEKRYMDLLSTITEEEYAIAVEKELTDIQIEISKLKTRMNDIRTDVAYSYVYININEVKEYTEDPVKTDTFLQRLGNTVSDATSSFLSFMETLLFIFIYLFPHLVIIGIIVFIVVKAVKASRKHRAQKAAAAQGYVPPAPAPVQTQPENKPEDIKK